ncbi:streptococcal hemagglutinin [Eurosta solidaginis]|uniref:streptococcal hemagglutinin n=1 Tax=Eurosta solidaginis TaxID=178769 RepID=UPI003530B82A
MLSVQTAGCAGMERLGVPTRTTLNSPPNDRGQYSCRMRVDALPAREILVRSETVIRSNNTSNSYSSSSSSSSNRNHQKQQQQQNLLHLEHHNQHSHHQQEQHHHHYQQQQQIQQHYQRMSVQQQEHRQSVASGSGSIARNGSMPARSNNLSISNSNFMRGGIEAATLKYSNLASGSGGGAGSGHSSNSGSNSSCNNHSIDHHQHYQQAPQLKQRLTPNCPHHVLLPDSEWGQDRNMQIRTGYQQSELTRSYIKPPPNKTIKDVPEQSSYNLTNALTALAGSSTALYAPGGSSASAQSHFQQQQQHKSKPNVITKLFSRKSSPKSPTALTSSSSSSSAASACSSLASSASISSMPVSASSSASSIASAAYNATSTATAPSVNAAIALSPSVSTNLSASALSSAPIASLPIATAATLKTTACNYGAANSLQSSTPPSITAGLAPSTQLLTTIGVSPTATSSVLSTERIPTPPLSVTVPIGAYHHHHQREQQHAQLQRFYQQQQQQMLLDSIVAESAKPTTSLQSLKSNDCELAMTSAAVEPNSSRNSLVAMDCYPSLSGDCASTASTVATIVADSYNCNCNSKDCKKCDKRAKT